MAVGFRAVGAVATGSNATLAVGIPSGAVIGDLLVLNCVGRSPVGATPAGWTLLRTDASAFSYVTSTYYRYCQSGDPGGTVTYTMTGAQGVSGAVVAYSGVRSSTPIYNSALVVEQGPGTGATSVNITGSNVTTVGDKVVKTGGGGINGGGSSSITGPATTRFTTGPTQSVTHSSDENPASTGVSGTLQATSPQMIAWGIHTFVIAQNSPPTAPTVTTPNGGETVDASTTITWTAGTDPDGDALTYDIDYSANTGSTWTNIVTGTSGLSYAWNTASLGAATTYLVRVRSRDTSAALSAYDQSNAVFTVAHISAPTSAATGFSNQRKLDRAQNGNVVSVYADNQTTAKFSLSENNGTTWSALSGMDILGFANGSIFIDLDDYLHVVWKQSGTGGGRTDGFIYYMRGTPNAGRTSWTFSAATALTGTALGNYPDVIAFREGTGWAVHYVFSVLEASNSSRATRRWANWTSGGVYSFTNQVDSNTYNSPGVHTFPSLDFNHTGDGKTVAGGTPHIYAAWSAGQSGAGFGIRFAKAVYSAGVWTWATEREIDNTRYIDSILFRNLACLFDGTRVIIGGNLWSGINDGMLYDRDAADTTTTTRLLYSLAGGTTVGWVNGSMTYDALGNVYFIGRAPGGAVSVLLTKWVRATTTLNASTATDAGFSDVNATMKRGFSNSRIEWVYTSGNNSPYAVKYDNILLNVAPLAPSLTAPANASTQPLAAGFTFSWTFNDTIGDTQSSYAFRRKISGAATYEYWNATTSVFQAGEVFNSSVTTSITFPTNAWTNGNVYQWSVNTRDNGLLTGVYASDFTVTASTIPTVTVTAPSGTASSSRPTITWSYADAENDAQATYEVRLYDSVAYSAGGFDPAVTTPLQTSGATSSSTVRQWTPTADLANSTTYRAYVRVTQAGGLASAFAFSTFSLNLALPAAPTITVTPDNTNNRATIAIQGRDNQLTLNQSSLETDTAGWVASGNSTVARSTAQALSGTASLSLTSVASGDMSANTNNAGPANAIVEAGQVYTAVASFRAATVGRAVSMTLDWFTSAGTFISQATAQVSADNTAGWQQVTVTAQAPSNAAKGGITLIVKATGAASEVHYVDAVGLFPDPTGNLVTNPDFENGTAGWAPNGGTYTQSQEQAYTGRSSMKGVGTSYQGPSTTVNLVVGQTYTYSAWVRTTASTSVNLATDSFSVEFTVAPNVWTRITNTAVCTVAATMFYVRLGGVSGTQTVYLDAVQVVVGASAVTYQPPTSSNLLLNPSAEVDLTNTEGYFAPTRTRDTSIFLFGTASVKVVHTGSVNSEGHIARSNVTLPTGTPVTVSAYVNAPAGLALALKIRVLGPTLVDAVIALSFTGTGAWQRVSATGLMPATGIPGVSVATLTTAPAGTTFYIDGAQVEMGSVATPYTDGSIGAGMVWEASENLLSAAASSFEDGTTGGWTLGANWTGANSAAQFVDGTKSLLLTRANATVGNGFTQRNIAATPNTTYTLSAWVRASAATSYSLAIAGIIAGTRATTAFTATANTWIRQSVTYTTSATETTIGCLLTDDPNGAPTNGSTIYLDAVQVEQKPYATTYAAPGTAHASTSRRQTPWTTGGFVGLSTYQIERSIDNVTWKVTRNGVVTPNTAQQVTFVDEEIPARTLAYYRAKVIANI